MEIPLEPDFNAFQSSAKTGNWAPICTEILADLETPVSAYLKLSELGGDRFILESVEQGQKFSRYSFVGNEPFITITCKNGLLTVTENNQTTTKHTNDPLAELQKILQKFKPSLSEISLPHFSGGAVGYMAYDCIRYIEPSVPPAKKDDIGLPDFYFILPRNLLIFDHLTRRLKIVVHANPHEKPETNYQQAAESIKKILNLLHSQLRLPVLFSANRADDLPVIPNMSREQYISMTTKMQDYIRSGDIFQVVPSQRFEVQYTGGAIDLYRTLRLVNPSPYMFCLEFSDFAVVGASPEVHIRCTNGKVEIRPIAGTRPRRSDTAEDLAMEKELLSDAKERAEHVMLVDLARNDIGRVCGYNTVRVTDFMVIERYSHVMHIVSQVEGQLQPGKTCFDAMRATFPAGTISGSPKVRAMQIISELEPTARAIYAGAVAIFSYTGNLDSCITIRTILLKDGKAYVQAGGGLVADSTPEGEYQESLNKARAGLRALALASAQASLD
jgi:anthranilate synthase component 1